MKYILCFIKGVAILLLALIAIIVSLPIMIYKIGKNENPYDNFAFNVIEKIL